MGMNPGIFRFKKKDVDVFICNDLKPALQCSKAAKKANQTLGRITRSLYISEITSVLLFQNFKPV